MKQNVSKTKQMMVQNIIQNSACKIDYICNPSTCSCEIGM